MLASTLSLLLALSLPAPLRAAPYAARPGDTLGSIAQRYHVSIQALALANGIANPNVLPAGRVLRVPGQTYAPSSIAPSSYHVRWGDTLYGLSARFHLSVAMIRSLNPSLGPYPLAGQWLNLCASCAPRVTFTAQAGTQAGVPPANGGRARYVVQPGDTLSGIASRYGVSTAALAATNRIPNLNRIVPGWQLAIPQYQATLSGAGSTRSLIVTYARQYGLEPSLPLAVGAQESAYNQNAVSRTGAVGVMQVEPSTGRQVSGLLGRPVNLYTLDDNIHAGVSWLAHLIAYYRGNERLAVAAYYQGIQGLRRRGFFQDTQRYVDGVMDRRRRLGG